MNINDNTLENNTLTKELRVKKAICLVLMMTLSSSFAEEKNKCESKNKNLVEISCSSVKGAVRDYFCWSKSNITAKKTEKICKTKKKVSKKLKSKKKVS